MSPGFEPKDQRYQTKDTSMINAFTSLLYYVDTLYFNYYNLHFTISYFIDLEIPRLVPIGTKIFVWKMSSCFYVTFAYLKNPHELSTWWHDSSKMLLPVFQSHNSYYSWFARHSHCSTLFSFETLSTLRILLYGNIIYWWIFNYINLWHL